MTPERFEELCREFIEHEQKLLSWKAGEYCDGSDRLQNFREIARFLECELQDVALAYLMKHIQSIALAVKTGEVNWTWETESGEGLKQRIADARNYLLLLAACIDAEGEP